ncbi:MAG: AAA family ATPase [Scytonema sp. PMC 1070.18]|nr:AAA family ATPase [Scytonema sp. PMC 1070.18]
MTKQAECIAFANLKGGTGKTTTCLSVGGYLAKGGSQVLIVDFDPQANATSGLGIDRTLLKHSLYDVFLEQCDRSNGVPITHIILETEVPNLHLVPSELDLVSVQILMQQMSDKVSILNQILYKINEFYDYILIDTPPDTGLFMLNALRAAKHVVVPLDFSIFSLEALDNLQTYCQDIEENTGHKFNSFTVLLTRVIKSSLFCKFFHPPHPSEQIETKLKEMFSTVFVIPESPEVYQAQRMGLPISHYTFNSKIGKAYENLTEYIKLICNCN